MQSRSFGAAALCLVVTVGCDRADNGNAPALEAEPTVRGDENVVPPRPVIVEGCLTASGDRFVLTELEPAIAGPKVAARRGERPAAEEQPTTENYRLVGMGAELRPLVGQRVEITGAAEPEKVVEVRESSPSGGPRGDRPAGTSGTEPRVSTVEARSIGNQRSARQIGETCRWAVPGGSRAIAMNGRRVHNS